jgi:hypothetical protein
MRFCWSSFPNSALTFNRLGRQAALAPSYFPATVLEVAEVPAVPTGARAKQGRVTALGLAGLIVASTVVRAVLALRDTTPRYFPDEYIYAALGRSIGHGHVAIRGVTSHFPALLEPILAAPAWAFLSTPNAYHAVQVENAAAASLVCVPIYLLSRTVGLGRWYSFGCAIYSVAIPSLVYVSFTTADAVAYPLAAAAVLAAVRSLDQSRPRRQAAFLVFAGLAAFARLEYLALVAGYVAAAALLDRRKFVRVHWVVLAGLSPALFAALVLGPSRILGYYSAVLSLHLGAQVLRWFLQNVYLLALQVGGILIPGALLAIVRPRGRPERSFTLFFAGFSLVLLIEAAAYSAQGPGIFKGRYLFVLLPLIPIAFGVYLKRGRPLPTAAIAIAGAFAVAAAEIPISTYTSETLRSSSSFLLSVGYAQNRIGVASTSIIVLATVTGGLAAAVALAFRGHGAVALLYVICLTALTSAGAVAANISLSRRVRATLPANLTWIDDAARGEVTAIATPSSPPIDLITQLYWNQSVQRELILGDATATDAFSAPTLRLGRGGRLMNARGDLLVHDFGTTLLLANARLVARADRFSLWRPRGEPRLRLLIEDRFWNGWLAPRGRIRAWPQLYGRAVKVTFQLSLPRSWPRKVVRIRLGRRMFAVERGSRDRVACESGGGPLDIAFSSTDFVIESDFRQVAARLTRIRVDDSRGSRSSTARCSAG